MIKSLLTAAALAVLAFSPASADVVLDTNGIGGTGTNLVFNSFDPTLGLVLGTLNGQHDEIVRLRDLSGDAGFAGTGGQNGNDIKIFNTADLDITVWDATNTTQLGTTRDIFSLKGTGTVFFRVTTQETDGSTKTTLFQPGGFDLGNGNQQNGFDFKAINGEVITDLDIFTVGGKINDFEHFRIDVAPLASAVPEASTWAMLIIGFAGIGFMRMRRRKTGEAGFRFA